MPLTPFLKMFGRLLLVTLLILALCAGLFTGVNAVRERHWNERFATPLMDWLASAPNPLVSYPWLSALYDMELRPGDHNDPEPVDHERLAYGQAVAEIQGLGVRVRRLSETGNIIDVTFQDLYRDIGEVSALIILTHLNPLLPDERPAGMDSLGRELGATISFVDEESESLETPTLERLVERGMAYVHRDAGERARVYLRLNDGTVVEVRYPAPFNPLAWPVLLLVFVLAASIAGFFLFLLLRDVDRNLRAVESVAIRIARGELDARVDTSRGTLVRRLGKSFNSMAEHIQRLVEIQREMIHAVSHELRTPVARIRFGVQMIEDCPDEASMNKQLAGIDGDIQELDELIDEILTYARLEQGGPIMSFQEISVPDIVRQVVEEQQRLRPDMAFSAQFCEGYEEWSLSDAEPRYIHRAIQNLVGNAGRYANGQVRVKCQLDAQTCRIDVEDDGPGIPDGDWEKVFTAFARLDDSRTRTSGGYGLGLSIVRRILYWHGGQAFVTRSEALGGAEFSLVWPRRQPQ
ncbi:MAG: two-component sensor histidine kinase [Alteromonadaceae bacterium]|nr:two-component sensor histidine kinase [Alteromonadaceae bacterium]MBH84563.1 two-component sensor histidine kinase [Alteromonadaceae bacterium]|tara:strand:- start:18184 stop:19746 length:1563 start_codon:yes stop_codon:yes gene_type:complete